MLPLVPQTQYLIEAEDPEVVAVLAPERSLTRAQLEHRARQLSNALEINGVGPGLVWRVLAHNRAEWPEFYLGNARAGTRLVVRHD